MRLKEIERVLSNIDFKSVTLSIESSHLKTRDLKNINNFKAFLEIIEQLSIYDDEINKIKQSELYQTSHDYIKTDRSSALELYRIAKYLTDSSSSLLLVFKKLLPSSSQESISVKLPEPSNFEDLVKTMSIFQQSISQAIVHKEIEGSVNINNWEHGSFWLELILGTQAAVALVSTIAWSAAVISKRYNENKILEQAIRAMEIKNDSLEDILNSQKEMTRQLVKNETDLVLQKHFTDKDPEHFKRVEATIKTFAKLIQEGAEVHPSLLAPEDVKNLFPNYKKIDSITSQIKQIEDKSTDVEEKDV